MVTAQLGKKPKKQWFKHEKTGRIFCLMYVTNEHARAIKRDKWQITAVYHDQKEKVWSCSLAEFESKFVEIDIKE